MSLNQVKCSALFAAIAPLLAGCGSADVRAFAFGSLDRATQIKYARAVATAFTRAEPLTVAFESGHFASHPREASTMMRLGYVERKNGAYHLTAAGRAASTIRCEYSGGPCPDVFVIGRSELVSISTVRFHEGAWPNGADAVVADVELRAVATTSVGRALATSSDLGCKSDNGTKPWHGSGTRANGTVVISLSQSFYGQYSFASVLDDADTSAGRTLFTSCPSEHPTLPPIIDGWSIEDAENEEKNRL